MKNMKNTTTCEPNTAESCCVVPQCEIRIEQCEGGCKIYCCCEDQVACKTMQNLCRALAGGLCTVCCCWNGICICQCDFACCHCTCEMTADGICICCKTGDKTCQQMIKAMCECLCCCQEYGCTCTVCFNNCPVCHCNGGTC
jgi:hypothetical protein